MEHRLEMPQNDRAQNDKAQEKEERKRRIQEQNEPPVLTVAEEVGNAVTHGLGAVLALVGMILLLLKSDTPLKVTASCFYGLSLFLMMLMSCLYHSFASGSKVKRVWRRFDYSSIYLLIGGTFAPLCLVSWGNSVGIALFCIHWTVIIVGITLIAVFGPAKWKPLHFSLYFIIGWSGLMFLPGWYTNNRPLLWMILLGGLSYTLGMIPFALHKKYSHFIWHLMVLLGAGLHWAGVYFFVY